MALKVPNASELFILDLLVVELFDNAVLHLYQNNITPADGDTLATYTEATFSGYAEITLDAWSAAFTDAGNKARVEEEAREFLHNGGAVNNSIYGYYITNVGSTQLLWAERNPAAPVVINAGNPSYTVLPRFTLNSEF